MDKKIAAEVNTVCFWYLCECAHLSALQRRNRRSSLWFVCPPIPLSPRELLFFPGFLWLYLGGLRDEKEGKKSSLVSALQKRHPEPNCHPTWIKGPSVVAAELLTWYLTLSQGVGGGRAPGLNKTSRSASPEPWQSHFVFPCQLYSWADSEVSPSFPVDSLLHHALGQQR